MENRKISLKISLWLAGMTAMTATTVISPLLASIGATYPDAGESTISMLQTITSLVMLPFMLLGGALSQKLSKKKILLIGFVLYTITGICTGLVDSIGMMLLMRALMGAATGLIGPLAGSLIADFFDGTARAKMMGQMNAVDGAIGIGFSMIAGMLAMTDWHKAFYLYGVLVIVIILIAVALPESEPDAKLAKTRKAEEKPVFTKTLAYLAIIGFLFMAISIISMLKQSFYLQEEGLGNAGSAGVQMALMTLFMVVFSLLFAKVYKVTKNYTLTIVAFLTALGFLLIVLAGVTHHVELFYIASAVSGIGNGLMLPYFVLQGSMEAPIAQRSFFIALLMCGTFLGQFVGAFLPGIIAGITGTDSLRVLFGVAAGLLVVLAIITIIH
ncbi:MAG: MFS transporter, partial [Clostridiales Family XIII bacterium]|nr:MFS transporter [Clostridiales Family XIII bacterium]